MKLPGLSGPVRRDRCCHGWPSSLLLSQLCEGGLDKIVEALRKFPVHCKCTADPSTPQFDFMHVGHEKRFRESPLPTGSELSARVVVQFQILDMSPGVGDVDRDRICEQGNTVEHGSVPIALQERDLRLRYAVGFQGVGFVDRDVSIEDRGLRVDRVDPEDKGIFISGIFDAKDI